MAIRLAQRRGFERRTFELEGPRLLVTETRLFSRRQVRVPAEVLFSECSELRTSSWIPAAFAVLYAVLTIIAIFDPDRDDGLLETAPIATAVAGSLYLLSRKRQRIYALDGSRVVFLAGGRREREIDEFVTAARDELRGWLRPRVLPFRTTGNLVADRERVEWLHDHDIVTDDERAAIVARLERMVRAAIAVDRAGGDPDDHDDHDDDDPPAERSPD